MFFEFLGKSLGKKFISEKKDIILLLLFFILFFSILMVFLETQNKTLLQSGFVRILGQGSSGQFEKLAKFLKKSIFGIGSLEITPSLELSLLNKAPNFSEKEKEISSQFLGERKQKETKNEKETKKIEDGQKPRQKPKEKQWTLEEIQEELDDIAERIEIIEGEINKIRAKQTAKEDIQEKENNEKDNKEFVEEKANDNDNSEKNNSSFEQEKETGLISDLENEKNDSDLTGDFEKGSEEGTQGNSKVNFGGGGGVSSGGSGGGSVSVLLPEILISEIKIAEKRGDKDVFIELYNPNDFEVDLTGWYIFRNDSSFVTKSLLEGKRIPVRGYFLLAREGSEEYSDLADVFFKQTLNEDDKISLKKQNEGIVDEVSWQEIPECCSFGRKWEGENYGDFEFQNPSPKTQNIKGTPVLGDLPEDLEFRAVEFGESQTISFEINKEGCGTLEWDSVIEYVSPSDGNWLEIEPEFGIVPTEVLVSVNVSDLARGNYLSKIIIKNQVFENDQKEINVSLILSKKEICPDINQDGKINVLDMILKRNELIEIRENLNHSSGEISSCDENSGEFCPDVNKDGIVNVLDMILVRNEINEIRSYLNQSPSEIPVCQ